MGGDREGDEVVLSVAERRTAATHWVHEFYYNYDYDYDYGYGVCLGEKRG